MTAIPDTATTVVRASHVPGPPQGSWSYDAYADLPEPDGYRYEIVDGVLFMSPAPVPDHENIVALIIARLVTALEDTEKGRVFSSPDISVGPSTLRPDTVVVLNNNLAIVAEKRLTGAPNLVVEVALPSTAAYDRDPVAGKLGAYARMGVSEYWIADPQTRSVELFVLDGDSYVSCGTFAGDDLLPSRVLPDLDLPVQRFFPREV